MTHIETLELNNDYAKFVLGPLERGFGQTIGNSLRRVLLSSIPGIGITAVRIEKVFHEFSAIPGVKEDATQILLNIKDLAIRLDLDYENLEGAKPLDEVTLKIEAKGIGKVTGADIVCPPGFSVINPEVYLATISEVDASLNLELYISKGTGYVLPEKHQVHRGIIGILPIGTAFSPVKNVKYFVEPTRVGMQTDYERLVLEVSTNGAVLPNDALTQAVQVLNNYYKLFSELGQQDQSLALEQEEVKDNAFANIPDLSVDNLDFSQRTYNCLKRAAIMTLRQLAATTANDLVNIRGFGKKSLDEVRDKLLEYGVQLKPAESFRIPASFMSDLD